VFDFVELFIQVIAAFVTLIAFAIAFLAFGSLSERLKVLILVQNYPYSILKEICLSNFTLVIILKDFDCC